MKFSPGTLFDFQVTPEVTARCKLVFKSQAVKRCLGLSYRGDSFCGRIFIADYGLDELIARCGTIAGEEPVNSFDLHCCRYVENDTTYCGNEIVPRQVEDEVCLGQDAALGADGALHDLRQLTLVELPRIDDDLAILGEGTTKLKRFYAAKHLAMRGPLAASARPALIRALGDEGKNVRRMSVLALARLGCRDAEVIAAIEMLRGDADEEVRKMAAWAIERLSAENSLLTVVYL